MTHAYDYHPQIPITEPARRVVSLVPSLTETLFDLNLGDRLVGITDYCIHPAEEVARLPRVGGTKNPDVAKIIALQPDLIFVNQEENRLEDVEAFRAAGINVWVTFPKTVQDVFNLIWDIMDAFHETSMVPRIRLIEYQHNWVSAMSEQRENAGEVCKVFVPIWLDPLMTFNQDTYMHDLLRVCGGTNVFAQRERRFPLKADLGDAVPLPDDDARVKGRDRRYPRVSWQEVEAAQPDVILLPTEPYQFTEADIPKFAALDVPAARNNRIHIVDGTYLTWHGTRIAYALNELPQLFFPVEEGANT
ncbi:MAG: helical backbone metal receptor [Phototrophicales bacterium]